MPESIVEIGMKDSRSLTLHQKITGKMPMDALLAKAIFDWAVGPELVNWTPMALAFVNQSSIPDPAKRIYEVQFTVKRTMTSLVPQHVRNAADALFTLDCYS